MSGRRVSLLPLQGQPLISESITTKQTGSRLLKNLLRPGIFIIVFGFFIAYLGITGITTASRKLHEMREPIDLSDLFQADGLTYIPIFEKLCEKDVKDFDNCLPYLSRDSSKKAQKCHTQAVALENCAAKIKLARKHCKEGDPDLDERHLDHCIKMAM